MYTVTKRAIIGTDVTFEYFGKSIDKKPLSTNGSKFIEMDTGKEYFFDGDEKGWFVQTDKYLDAIEIETPPTKTSYYVGDKFDATGAVVKAKYTDESVQTVSNFEVDAPEPLAIDSKVAIVYVENGRTRRAEVEIEIKSNEASDADSFAEIAKNGSAVVLANDIAITKAVAFTNDFNLDLNGHELATTANISYMIQAKGAKLTITGNGKINAKKRLGQASEGGEIIIEGGVFTSTTDVGFDAIGEGSKITFNGGELHSVEGGLLSLDGAAIEVNGGEFYTADNFPIGTNGSENRGNNTITINGGYYEGHITSAGYEAIGFYIANNDTVTINGGEIKAFNGTGILMRGGTVVINDMKITATGVEGGGGFVGDKKTKMSQSAIIFDEKSLYPGHEGMNLTINGGTFIGFDHSLEVIPAEGIEPDVKINGGAFIPVVA